MPNEAMPNEAMPNDGTPGGDVASAESGQARPIAVLASGLLSGLGRPPKSVSFSMSL
jgi:hypothetical protein